MKETIEDPGASNTRRSLLGFTSDFSLMVKAGHFQGARRRMGLGKKFEEREGVKKPSWKGERKLARETQQGCKIY